MPEPLSSLPVGPGLSDPTPRPFPHPRVLEGSRVSLIPMNPDRDGEGLYTASHGSAQREQVWTYLPAGPFANARALVDWYRQLAEPGDPRLYTLMDFASQNPIGVTSLLSIRPEHGVLEIGHVWCAPEVQRSAANTEANYLLLREAFDELGYRRVEWKCDALNARSRAAALRLGFQFEGVFRQHLITRDRNRDTAWFSILDSEWPRARTAMQDWLEWDPSEPRPALADLRSKIPGAG